MKPVISILMPAKNAAKYLEECLDSIVNQSVQNWELLVVDDHSTDNTIEILNEYRDRDPRVSVWKNEGKGIIDALRTAFRKASGNFITRMDADDIMSMHKLRNLFELVKEVTHPCVAVGKVEYFSEGILGDGFKQYAEWLNGLGENHVKHFDEIFKECVIPSPAWMCSRDHLQMIGAFDESRYPEDYDLCFRFCVHNFEVRKTKDLVHHWRDYPERTSRNDEHYKDHRFLDLKMYYFINHFKANDRPLVIWGTGKTAKKIALSLNENGITYHWVTDNSKKIGHNIYGTIVEHFSKVKELNDAQVIVRVANKEEQQQIKDFLEKLKLEKKLDVYYFC